MYRTLAKAVCCLIALVLAVSYVPPCQASAPLPHYQIVADLDYASASLVTTETVNYTNDTRSALDSIVFNVTPAHFDSFTLFDCKVNGKPATANIEGAVLEVALETPLLPRQSVLVDLEFEVDVPQQDDRLGSGGSILALGNWFPILSVFRTPRLTGSDQPAGWDRSPYTAMGDPFYSQAANFQVRINTSDPVAIAHTGELVEKQENSWIFKADKVRDFAMAISTRYESTSQLVDGVEITAYYLPEHATAGAQYLDIAVRTVQWLNEAVGSYPYPSLHVAEIYSSGQVIGQEYPNLVFIGSSVSALTGGIDSYLSYVISHEVAHQWFYAIIGNDQFFDPWLDESLATWSAYHFVRVQRPDLFPGLWQYQVKGPLEEAIRIYGSTPVNTSMLDFSRSGHYVAIVYRRGAVFIEEMYHLMGNDDFFSALQQYFSAFKFQVYLLSIDDS